MPRKSAKIESKRAGLNMPENVNTKTTRKYTKKATKTLKKANILICLLLLVVGIGVGVGSFFIISKNDCFTLLGEQEITVEMTLNSDETLLTGTFTDNSKVKIIEFGKDISNEVIIETDMKQNSDGSYSVNEEGTYYIKYKVNSIKYGKLFKIEKIRLISFVEPSVSEEIEKTSLLINGEVE